MDSIKWPDGYLPGLTDNFVSNEVVVLGLGAADVWKTLIAAERWPSYYDHATNIRFKDGGGPDLAAGARFSFDTLGLTIDADVTEFVPPRGGQSGRLAWHGGTGEGDTRLDVIHAWLIEDLSEGRLRILTQETQNGGPAKDMTTAQPNPMINAHQNWLIGLVRTTRQGQR